MRILIIDNYDSFTYNLYQYFGEIIGQPPIVITNDSKTIIPESEYDAIVISPGPGSASLHEDFGICSEFIEKSTKPILGICLGHQGIVLSEGGCVSRSPEPIHGRTDEVIHNNHSQFAHIPTSFQVVRYHSLIAQEPIPKTIEVTATTSDGLIMAIAHKEKPIWGVQFHPESINSEYGKQILRNFTAMASLCRPKNRTLSHFTLLDSPPPPKTAEANRWVCRYRIIQGDFDPEVVYSKFFGASSSAFWLDSSKKEGAGTYHILGDASGPNGYTLSYTIGSPIITTKENGTVQKFNEDVYSYLKRHTTDSQEGSEELPFNFTGGFVGYLGYELKELSTGTPNRHKSNQPDASLCFSDRFIAIDKQSKTAYIVGIYRDGEDENSLNEWFDTALEKLRLVKSESSVGSISDKNECINQTNIANKRPVIFELEQDQNEYINVINETLNHIDNGETYELCLTNRIRTKVDAHPWNLYKALRSVNPAPYSAFLNFPGFSVLSSSPERFLKVCPNNIVEAKPIKGTRPRSQNQDLDQEIAADLAKNEKDRAENLMITDLLRNDLGRVCEIGSIWVPKLMAVESYETVHQLVSTIRGQLPQKNSVVDLVESAFPGGSMTGAPKRRTMEIIDSLEQSARGVYSGSIGYFSLNGTTDLNIVIRTIVHSESSGASNSNIEIGVGGAIISLSNPYTEYAEILVKAEALMKAVAKCVTGSEDAFILREKCGNSVDIERIKRENFYSNNKESVKHD